MGFSFRVNGTSLRLQKAESPESGLGCDQTKAGFAGKELVPVKFRKLNFKGAIK